MIEAPTFSEEERANAQGYRLIAGIDEVGRGPLAGPVVAAAIILSRDSRPPWLSRVRDSKQLTALERERLFPYICREALAVGTGTVSAEVIDAQGIVAATRLAMCYAVEQLRPAPDFLLIDALSLPALDLPQRGIIKGDTLSLSIAAASIVAKVTRDRLMVEMDALYPGYRLAKNKGYATPEHEEALQRLGACPIHRRTFAPVCEVL